MNLKEHAQRELQAAGLFDEDSDYDGMLGASVMELIEAFASQGHSGFSASMTSSLFNKLSRFEPLGPLTGEEDEWQEVGGEGLFQNLRCSRVFKNNDGAYDLDGKIFREPNGVTYTSYTEARESSVPITFPYTPTSEIIDLPFSDEHEEGDE